MHADKPVEIINPGLPEILKRSWWWDKPKRQGFSGVSNKVLSKRRAKNKAQRIARKIQRGNS